MRQGVAGVGGDRTDPVLLDDRRQQLGAAAKRNFPADLLPAPVDLDQWVADAIRVVVQRGKGHAFWADVSATPDVVAVAADAGDFPVFGAAFNVNLQAAHGFTQWTGTQMPVVVAGRHPLTVFRYLR